MRHTESDHRRRLIEPHTGMDHVQGTGAHQPQPTISPCTRIRCLCPAEYFVAAPSAGASRDFVDGRPVRLDRVDYVF